jgi:hypothetical protein
LFAEERAAPAAVDAGNITPESLVLSWGRGVVAAANPSLTWCEKDDDVAGDGREAADEATSGLEAFLEDGEQWGWRWSTEKGDEDEVGRSCPSYCLFRLVDRGLVLALLRLTTSVFFLCGPVEEEKEE